MRGRYTPNPNTHHPGGHSHQLSFQFVGGAPAPPGTASAATTAGAAVTPAQPRFVVAAGSKGGGDAVVGWGGGARVEGDGPASSRPEGCVRGGGTNVDPGAPGAGHATAPPPLPPTPPQPGNAPEGPHNNTGSAPAVALGTSTAAAGTGGGEGEGAQPFRFAAQTGKLWESFTTDAGAGRGGGAAL